MNSTLEPITVLDSAPEEGPENFGIYALGALRRIYLAVGLAPALADEAALADYLCGFAGES